MQKIVKLAVVAAAGLLLATPAFSQDKVVAKVNGVAIPQSRVDALIKEATSQGQADSPRLREAALDQLVNIELVLQEVRNKGLDKQPEVIEQIEMARQSVLVDAFVKDYNKNHPISEDALRKEYERVKNDPSNVQYRVSHIVVATEDEAKAIEAQLKKKGDFKKIAKAKSMDTGSKGQGGDLGWHGMAEYAQVDPSFAEALTHLKKGEISAPVQSPQGAWHIILLEDTRNAAIPPFEQAQPYLMRGLQQQAVKKYVEEMKKNAKIEKMQ